MERKSLFAPRVDLPQFLALFAMTECFEGGGLTVHFAVLFCPKFADSVHPRFCPTIIWLSKCTAHLIQIKLN